MCCAVLKLACTVCVPLRTTMVSVVLPRCLVDTVVYQYYAPSMRSANAGGEHDDWAVGSLLVTTKIWSLDSARNHLPLAISIVTCYLLRFTYPRTPYGLTATIWHGTHVAVIIG